MPVIFCYWLFALGVKFFGLTPFVARFWPAFFVTLYSISSIVNFAFAIRFANLPVIPPRPFLR